MRQNWYSAQRPIHLHSNLGPGYQKFLPPPSLKTDIHYGDHSCDNAPLRAPPRRWRGPQSKFLQASLPKGLIHKPDCENSILRYNCSVDT